MESEVKSMEKNLCLERMRLLFKSRNELVLAIKGMLPNENAELEKAYSKLEQAFVDIIIAEVRFLTDLK